MRNLFKIISLFVLLNTGFNLNAKNKDSEDYLVVPTATISGTTTVCQNAAQPLITFTGSGGTAPYTFTYTINGGANQTIATTTGNSVTVSAQTTTAGTFVYNLISVHDTANPTPEQPSTGTATVIISAPPLVDFTFTNDNTCSGTAMQFSATASGTATYTYAWDFGDSTTSTQQNPSHTFISLGCGTASFSVTLTVTGGGCAVTTTKTVTVKQQPDISFTDVNNQFEPFNNCANAASNSVYTVTVGNTSISSCISLFSINWGDGNSQSNVTFPIQHTYNAIGAYNMVITGTGINGCVNIKNYIVKNVSNPIGGLNSPGSTQNLCAPTTNLQFSISNWGGNSLDTTYKINYGDGTPLVTLTQSQLNSSIYYNSSNPLNSANYPIPHIYTTSSCPAPSFEVKLEITNACGMTPLSLGNISILTKPAANFTAPNSSCVNTNVLFNNTTISGYGQNCVQGSIYTWDFGDGTPIITTPISSPQNINHIYTNSGTYSVTLTAQNGCGTTSKSQTICIEPPLTPQFNLNNNSGCSPLAVTATNTTITTNCTTPTYIWNVVFVPSTCGTSIPTIPNQTTTNASYNFTEPGTYTIKLTATNSCSPAQSTTQIVTVKKPPTITSINGLATNYCGPTTINPTATVVNCGTSALTYAWSFPGGTPSTSTSSTPVPISYTSAGNYTVSLTITNECGASATTTKTFTINDTPVLTNTPLTQTICSGTSTALVTLTSSPAGATFTWTATATAGISGFTPSGTNTIPIQTISTSNTSSGTVTYAIKPSLGGCPGVVTNYVITVNPAPAITTQPASSTVCLSGTPNILSFTATGVIGTPTYQWYSNIANNTTNGTAIPGETNATYSPPTSTVGTLYYYCIITLPSGGCSNIKTNTATVTVLPNATITTQPTPTQSICVGITIPTPLTISYSGGTGTVSYQWYANTTNATVGGSLITGATSTAYTPPVYTIPSNYYYYATVSLSGNGCSPATSNVAEIVVFADPTVSVQPITTQTLCQNATPSNLNVTTIGGNGAFSYQWFSSLTNSNTGGTLIFGATNNSFTPPTNTVGTKYYYCVVSQSTVGCGVTSATAEVIIISAPTNTTPLVSSTVCLGGTPTPLSVSVSGATGTPTYQWYSNNNTSGTGGTLIPSQTTATFNPPATTPGIFYYYCSITLPSGGCSSITTNTATVTINDGATINTQPTATQSLCVGATIVTPLTVSYSGGTGTVSYQWYSNVANSNSGGTPISGATNITYTPPVFTTTGNYYYYVTLSFSGNGCGPISSNPAEIIVVSDPTINVQPVLSQTLCQGAIPTNLTVTATGGIGTYLYQWFSNSLNSNSGGSLIPGATNGTFTPPTNLVGKGYYYCVITQATGTGCNVTTATAEVIVNLAPSIVTQPQSSIICLGKTPTQLSVTYTNGVGTPRYQWYSNSSNTTLGSTPISGAINANYNPPNTTTGTVFYYCIITLPPTGGCSSLTSSIAEVTISPNPVISSKTDIICSGKTFTVIPVNSGSEIVPIGTTYTWANPTISPAGSINGASAQSTPQTSISQTLINTTTSPAIVTYTVTPISGICTGTNFTIAVTVNPAISSNVTTKNSACFGANNGSIQTNITGGIPYSSGAPYSISWTGPNGFTSSAPNIANLAPGNYNLSITDAGGCPINENYAITEPSDIIILTDVEKDITCFNDANGEIKITITGGTLNYTYTWTKNGTPFATTEDLSNLSPGIYAVTVSDANNCGPKTASFTITEPPILAANLVSKTDIVCFGQATGAITINVVGGTLPYTYAWTGPNGFTNSSQNLTNIFAGTYNVLVTDSSGCTKNLAVTLIQNPEIKITAATTPIICYGGNDASITLTITGGVAPYTIVWSNLGSGTFQDNLSAGDYLITVTDALNCVNSLNVNIPEAPVFTINPVVKNITCFGDKNGSINLNLVGGIPPVKLVWDDSAVAGTVRNNLGPGSYTVTITDGKPCTIKRTFIILEPQLLVLSANITHALDCNDANSGAINLLVSGGSAPFTYSWSNGATTEDLANIPAGNYLVTVKDANGCTQQAQYSINRPPPIVPGVKTQTDFNCETKYVKQTFVAQVTGGVPPYQLVWSSGTVSGANNEMMTTNQNGTVLLNVTDAIGCKANYTFNVDIPLLGSPSFDLSSMAKTNYGLYSINDPIQFTNTATGDFISMIWDFGDGTTSTELNPVHTYVKPKDYIVIQTVTYPFGCVYIQKITLAVEKGYVLVVPTAFTPNNDSLNDTFRPVTKGLKKVRLDIYDTWGSMIYSETGDVIKGWDGKIKGNNSENGNYYCKVSGETFYGTTVNENTPFVLIK